MLRQLPFAEEHRSSQRADVNTGEVSPVLNHDKQILNIIFVEDPLLGFIETKCSSVTKCCTFLLALRNPLCDAKLCSTLCLC